MFKKVFKSISKALGSKEAEAAVPQAQSQPAAPAKTASQAAPAEDKSKAKAAEKAPAPAKVSAAPAAPTQSPEELCAVTPKMSKEEIKARLAFLYRRYNRATSSLDPKLRAEADTMLDAIVTIREKVFGAL